MVHIFKSKNDQFCLAAISDNGESLYSTETFTQKKNAWVNIKAVAKLLNGDGFYVQDDTAKGNPVVYYCTIDPFTGFKKLRSKTTRPELKHNERK